MLTRSLLRALAALLLVSLAGAQSARETLLGTWDGTCEPPGIVGGDPFSLRIEAVEGEAVRGTLVLAEGPTPCAGTFAPAEGTLILDSLEAEPLRVELRLADGVLAGQGRKGPWEWGFRVTRASVEVLARDHAPRVVDLARAERPEDFALVGLPEALGLRLDDLMQAFVAAHQPVGLSVACVVGGELVDVRSSGWEDFFAGVPASAATRYRWASISKPLTATAAARLLAAGKLDLDRDVRALVPEYPAQVVDGAPAVVTARDILRHQSGIVHYEGARRTWRAYEEPHPFERLVHGLDLFRESPLAFAPHTRESYSTHAWTLLGLVLERAAEKPYAEIVRELVLGPAGMAETEPDHPSRSIPHRSAGYEADAEGRLVEIFGDDVSWKLPGGGWISTVGDLARFGAALCGSALLDEERKALFWSAQALADGTPTGMGLGFALDDLAGERVVQHSGGQRKAATFLMVLPERGLAVAVMSNTARLPVGDLAGAVLRLLRQAQR